LTEQPELTLGTPGAELADHQPHPQRPTPRLAHDVPCGAPSPAVGSGGGRR
jgi:hypothetical protein